MRRLLGSKDVLSTRHGACSESRLMEGLFPCQGRSNCDRMQDGHQQRSCSERGRSESSPWWVICVLSSITWLIPARWD